MGPSLSLPQFAWISEEEDLRVIRKIFSFDRSSLQEQISGRVCVVRLFECRLNLSIGFYWIGIGIDIIRCVVGFV